jgi:hypothetical protein
MVAIIKRESSSLGMPSTNLWSPKLNIDLTVGFGVTSIVLCLATLSDSSCRMTPLETVAMDWRYSYLHWNLAWMKNRRVRWVWEDL